MTQMLSRLNIHNDLVSNISINITFILHTNSHQKPTASPSIRGVSNVTNISNGTNTQSCNNKSTYKVHTCSNDHGNNRNNTTAVTTTRTTTTTASLGRRPAVGRKP